MSLDNVIEGEKGNSLEKAEELFSDNRIKDLHTFVELKFQEFFEDQGYMKVSPLPLISNKDSSVLFTGSSISAVKDTLNSGDFPPDKEGVFLAQECIRTKAFHHAFENEWIPYGQIYFEMLSVLSRPGRFKEVFLESMNFFQEKFNIGLERLKIRTTSKYQQINNLSDLTQAEIEIDTKPEKYYKWEYGIPDVHGEGLTFSIYNPARKTFLDVGNLIIIYDASGKELGIEAGFGVEYFLTAAMGIDEALKLSKVYEIFAFEYGLSQKYYSTLEAVSMMHLSGADIGRKKTEHVYKQYLKSLSFIGQSLGKSSEEIIEEMKKFSKFKVGVEVPYEQEQEFFRKHMSKKADFKGLLKRVHIYLTQQGKSKESFTDPELMLYNYLCKNGIDMHEVEVMFEKYEQKELMMSIKKRFDI